MSVMNPFRKNGPTSVVAISTAASAAIQPSTGNIQGLLATWVGSLPCYIEYSSTIGSSNIAATVPTTSTPGSMPILPNTAPSFTVPPNCWISAISSAGTGLLYLTEGDGF
jgi:hypothetical protein